MSGPPILARASITANFISLDSDKTSNFPRKSRSLLKFFFYLPNKLIAAVLSGLDPPGMRTILRASPIT